MLFVVTTFALNRIDVVESLSFFLFFFYKSFNPARRSRNITYESPRFMFIGNIACAVRFGEFIEVSIENRAVQVERCKLIFTAQRCNSWSLISLNPREIAFEIEKMRGK